MSKRFFISDMHFNSMSLISENIRPFKTVEKMNETILHNVNQRCKEDDILISCGDVCQFGNDRKYGGVKINPREFTSKINATFVNIKGNHDDNNKVKSVCESMRTSLGKKYTSVSISHYPSNDPRAAGTFRRGDIHIHGHIHCRKGRNGEVVKPPKYTIDFTNKVLNINVNCELWNYNPISEDELIQLIDNIMRSNGNLVV